jgi:hypothetical protein
MRNTTCNILLNSYAQWCTAVKDRDLLQAFPMLNMCNETPSEIVTVDIGLNFANLLPFPVKDSFLPIARETNGLHLARIEKKASIPSQFTNPRS